MVAIFTVTIFLGAALLFAVQPLFARLLLPLLGGAPAVWNTCLLFFQATLLAGYGYAHLLSTRVLPRRQGWVHGAVLLVALASLPIALPAGWTPPADQNPIPWLLAAAAVAVGLPFFVVSATSPLLQRWFSATGHPASRDPYFLYAASNAGSLLALLAYPVLLEPLLGLRQQGRWWTAGYGLLAVLVLACATRVTAGSSASSVANAATAEEGAISVRRRVRWVLLALAPSSLMLSVTNYISMDLAAVPLFWVVPLAIYLGTFTLAFARRQLLGAAGMTRLYRLLLVMVVILLAMRVHTPLLLLIPLHLLGLFAAAWMCHRELAMDRPPPARLTEFYFWIALGGVLGGAFNALVAPLVFRWVWEYPLGLLLACLLVPRPKSAEDSLVQRRRDLVWPAGLLCGSVALSLGLHHLWPTMIARPVGIAVPALIGFSFAARPLRYALALAVVLLIGALHEWTAVRLIATERTFFGIHRVAATDGFHRLSHGTTLHGLQSRDPARRGEPLSYYTRTGPLGQLLATSRAPAAGIGLGAGALAAYARAGDEWTFYEIDPAVVRIARDPSLFTYLADCPANVRVVLGDARLKLRDAPDASYRLIVLDAYNSDAIPLHLITREAVRLYLQKLHPGGVLAWHITNRHMELEPVVAALARDAGLVCLIRNESSVPPAESAAGKSPSKWAVMGREKAALGPLLADARWRQARERSGMRLWTDDYANPIGVLKWRVSLWPAVAADGP